VIAADQDPMRNLARLVGLKIIGFKTAQGGDESTLLLMLDDGTFLEAGTTTDLIITQGTYLA